MQTKSDANQDPGAQRHLLYVHTTHSRRATANEWVFGVKIDSFKELSDHHLWPFLLLYKYIYFTYEEYNQFASKSVGPRTGVEGSLQQSAWETLCLFSSVNLSKGNAATAQSA